MEKFIKLYPHHLLVLRHDADTYMGELVFSLEQYGLLMDKFEFKLLLLQPNKHYEYWRFACEDPTQLRVPSFLMFLKSVEHYVFGNLKFSPQHAVMPVDKPKSRIGLVKDNQPQQFQLHFKDIFFDLSTQQLQQLPR